jgi:general secretion pathway protein F/type IV pilus assembly protein PilC
MATQRLTAVLEPLLIVLLALLVGFIAFATILPILEVSNVL